MQLLDGKQLASLIRADLKIEVEALKARGIRPPHLSAILVGNDAASATYVNNKIKACEEIGFGSSLLRFDEDISEDELLAKVNALNTDDKIDGFIVQLPLPAHINVDKVIEAVAPDKDADGFHPVNIGRMVKNLPALLPATPKGIIEMLRHYKVETSGRHCVVVGRSQIVGLPVSILLGRKSYPGDCTVTLAHSRTKNIAEVIRQADIIIAAIGLAHFIKEDMVKQGAVIIDVGTNSIPDSTKKSGYRLTGDVDFDHVAPKCAAISPVPGGVGPMTIASLLQNTMQAAKMRRGF